MSKKPTVEEPLTGNLLTFIAEDLPELGFGFVGLMTLGAADEFVLSVNLIY